MEPVVIDEQRKQDEADAVVRELAERARSTKEVEYRVVEITPYIAQALAKIRLPKNRDLSKDNLEALKHDLRAGTFYEGTGIFNIDKRGLVLNGNHRCDAVIDTGISFKVCIALGVEPASYEAIDTGLPKKTKDFLKLRASDPEMESLSTNLAATIRLLYRWTLTESNPLALIRQIGVSTSHLLGEVLPQHPSIVVSAQFARKNKEMALFEESSVAFLHYAFHRIDSGAADEFLNQLFSGVNVAEDMPAKLCRDRLDLAKGGLKKNKLNKNEKLALVVTAWNRFKEGIRSTKALKLEYEEPSGKSRRRALKIDLPYPGPENPVTEEHYADTRVA